MKELLKLAPFVQQWAWPKLGYLAAIALLLKRVITFDQALVLIFLAIMIDWFVGQKYARDKRPRQVRRNKLQHKSLD